MLTFHVRCVTIADISPTRPQAKMSKKQRPRRFNGALFHGLPLLVGVEQSLTGSGYEVGPDGEGSVSAIHPRRKEASYGHTGPSAAKASSSFCTTPR